MRGTQFLTAAVLASLAGACGNHGADGHEWTAEELAELEHKWGMEVSLLGPFFCLFFCMCTVAGWCILL